MHIHFLLLFWPGESKENMNVFLKIKRDDPEMAWRNVRSFFRWTVGNSAVGGVRQGQVKS